MEPIGASGLRQVYENVLQLRGDAGDNMLRGDGGDDTLEGGDGTDTAVYLGLSGNYTIADNGDGTFTITDTLGDAPDGVDTLIGMEFAQFADTTIAEMATM